MDFASKEVIAARMRERRKALDLDQHEIAAVLKVTQPAVCAWEAATQLPRRDTWAAVAAAYGSTMEELFFARRVAG